MNEVRGYPAPAGVAPGESSAEQDYAGVVVPFRLAADGAVLSFFSTTTTFGTPVDITLAELALECLYPADPATAEALHNQDRRSPTA